MTPLNFRFGTIVSSVHPQQEYVNSESLRRDASRGLLAGNYLTAGCSARGECACDFSSFSGAFPPRSRARSTHLSAAVSGESICRGTEAREQRRQSGELGTKERAKGSTKRERARERSSEKSSESASKSDRHLRNAKE